MSPRLEPTLEDAPPGGPVEDGADDERDLGSLARSLEEARDQFVARYIRAVIRRSGGNRERAAAQLGISIRSLYRLG